MITASSLQRIFDAQHALAKKFAPNEVQNGYSPPVHLPMNLDLRETHQRLRSFAWCITEEVVEAMTAPKTEYADELSDVLHFAVEICLIAGVPPEDVVSLAQADLFDPLPEPPELIHFLVEIGLALNNCKAKPWKLTFLPPDPVKVRYHLAQALFLLLRLIKAEGYDPEDIYFKKMKVNEQRINDHV